MEATTWSLRKRLAETSFFHGVYALVNVFLAMAMMWAVDSAVARKMEDFLGATALTILVVCFSLACGYLARRSLHRYVKAALLDVKAKRFDYLAGQRQRDQDMAAFSANVDLLYGNYYMNKGQVLYYLSQFVFSCAAIIYLSWKLAIVVLLVSFLPVFVPMFLQRYLQERTARYADTAKRYLEFVKDVMEGAQEVRAYGVKSYFRKMHGAYNEAIEEARAESRLSVWLSGAVSMFVGSFGFVATIFICGYLTIRSEITIGVLIAVVQLMNSIVSPVGQLAEAMGEMKAVAPMEKQYRTEKAPAIAVAPSLEGDWEALVVQDLSFSYVEDKPMIRGVSYGFERGKSYLLKGPSGIGKSSFAKLLGGELEAQEGQIFLNKEGRQWRLAEHPQLVHYVAQEPYLFALPVKENIRLGKAFSEDVLDALLSKLAIQDLSEEADGRILANRESVSGGQKQRIVLARALLHGAPILVLDEPTANVDAKTAMRMLEAIQEGPQETLIVIAHHVEEDFEAAFDEVLDFESLNSDAR